MEKELTGLYEELLRDQRRTYLNEFRRAEDGLDALSEERETELEEHGQEEQIAVLLTRLDERTLNEVREIDAALQRIVDGTYGVCQQCAEPIASARLRILPASRFCIRCAPRADSQRSRER